ncbi:MAG: hypothetical protein AAF216_10435 [Pseudomonadota bacterium]
MAKHIQHLSLAVFMLALASCGSSTGPYGLPKGEFWNQLTSLCGNAYEGRVTTTYSADRDWRRERLILDVAECDADGVLINFNIGDDRTRTWTITPREDGTIGYHIGRDEGTGPGLTGYGGISVEGPDALAQVFPIDEPSKAMFEEIRLILSLQNVWSLTFDPGAGTLTYHVQRIDSERGMQFDISSPVSVETPDGWEAVDF